jgi:hypothetical protein
MASSTASEPTSVESSSSAEAKAFNSLEKAEHLPIRFFHGSNRVDSLLKLPLTLEPVDPTKGTQCLHLELWLKEKFGIPAGSSVFAIVPVFEPYSPALPLVLLNTIAHRLLVDRQGRPWPVLDFALVVRSTDILQKPLPPPSIAISPFFPIPGCAFSSPTNSLERQQARLAFVEKLKTYGFARIQVSPEIASIPQAAFESARKWLRDQVLSCEPYHRHHPSLSHVVKPVNLAAGTTLVRAGR